MANVNPPPQNRLPKKILNDIELYPFFRELQQIIFQLWLRTGGNNDAIENGEQNQTATSSRVSRNAAKINALELDDFVVVVTTVNETSNLNNIFICKNPNPIEITLDPEAIEGDEVHIKRRNAKVTVIGNVDGKDNPVINIKNYSMHCVFDGADWSEI